MGFTSPGTDNAALREILAELQAHRAGGRHPFEDLHLEEEQEGVLALMLDAERDVPRERRAPFLLVRTSTGAVLVHDGFAENREVAAGDVLSLAEAGLLRLEVGSRGAANYEVTNQGRAYHAWMKERDGEPLERVEAEVRHLLDGPDFQARHPAAYARWTEAEAALWSAESVAEFTNIGHACREAIQLFVTDLVERHQPAAVEPDPQKTVARLKAVLATVGLRSALTKFLDALLVYFGTVSDLVQRQEHGGQKEGEPLTWEDGRRVVFQAGLVMFELDRALG
jgi:hypothetical protein